MTVAGVTNNRPTVRRQAAKGFRCRRIVVTGKLEARILLDTKPETDPDLQRRLF